ncbi:MAG TPA: hypothetical protein VG477_18585, partial [Thermoanaerobaculia bacterium]|nr:hypothetical protein [Thermoanaerobaculia bacterium]
YVLGDVALEEDALRELAGWIGARHWTVLLIQDATGQAYTDRDGILRSGIDAIEYAAGQGIPARPGFAEQLHPQSKEPDGAVFTIVLAQRALFYSGSQTQDQRGLGEDRFQGELDQWAIEALRSGGDVESAVRNTITNIDDRLASAIAYEIESAKQARDLEIENAKRYVVATASILRSVERKAAGLRKAYPALKGPLVEPDLQTPWRNLAAAEALLSSDPREALRKALEVQTQGWTAVRLIDRYVHIGEELKAAEAELARLERREHADAARQELLNARQALNAARELHRRAAPGYERVEAAIYAVSIADRKISSAEASAELLRFLLGFLSFALAAGLLIGGVTLNLRRRGVKREARELLDAWHTALDTKLEAILDELERRVDRFVGPRGGSWEGETLRLAEAIRADVGSLYILWTSASGVLQLAGSLIRARGLGAVYNFFFPGKYRRGIALLKDEPVPFDPADGLPTIFGYERTWRDDLLGDLASYEPFRKTFQEIVDELNLRASRAAEALDIVEVSVMDGPSDLDRTGELIRGTAALENPVQMASFVDGAFLVPALFATTLPAAEAALARARALFPADPVTALAGTGATARRIAVEAAQLAAVITGARRGALPVAEAGMATLGRASIGAGWIAEERSRLSSRADLLAGQAAEEEAAPGIEELAQDIARLGERVERAVALSRILGETARPEIQRVTGLVHSAREELGRALALPPDSVLREEGADPSERLEGASRQASTAHESLGRGDLETATATLSEAARLTSEAEAIVEATWQAFADQAT